MMSRKNGMAVCLMLAALAPLELPEGRHSAGRRARCRRSRPRAAASWSRFRPVSSRWGAVTVETRRSPCTRYGSTHS